MTPKEKAEELIDKYYFISTHDGLDVMDKKLTEQDRKQCALIAVNEMISMLPFTDLTTYIGKWCEQQRQYLEDVKQEIEKL
jgi:hypothetical protein